MENCGFWSVFETIFYLWPFFLLCTLKILMFIWVFDVHFMYTYFIFKIYYHWFLNVFFLNIENCIFWNVFKDDNEPMKIYFNYGREKFDVHMNFRRSLYVHVFVYFIYITIFSKRVCNHRELRLLQLFKSSEVV